MTNKSFFTVDFFARTISGTKASFNKASKGNGPAYEELTNLMARHPDFKLVIKEPKKHTTTEKRKYDGLDFPFMERYISIQSNAEQVLKEYKAIKKMAKDAGSSIYPFTKKWFLKKYSTEEQPFDMAQAKKNIDTHYMNLAIQSAAAVSKNQDTRDLALVG